MKMFSFWVTVKFLLGGLNSYNTHYSSSVVILANYSLKGFFVISWQPN